MRAQLRKKQKSLQTARNIRNKANKLKKDKDPSFKQLEKEAKEHDNLAKQAENEHKQIQQQLKKIARSNPTKISAYLIGRARKLKNSENWRKPSESKSSSKQRNLLKPVQCK